jgi:ribonucleases P/MRP protein subunit RPP40
MCFMMIGTNSILGLIKRNFQSPTNKALFILHKSFVRPHLEYCAQCWRPHLIKDIDCLERVQRRATKLASGLRHKNYQERLKILGLTTLQQRCIRGGLIETFKILIGREEINKEQFFSQPQAPIIVVDTLVNPCNPPPPMLICTSELLLYHTVKEWNQLPQFIVDATSVNMFKARLDQHWADMGN